MRRQDLLIRRQLEALTELGALKDDLVALIVHDLRNPLSGLLSILSVARAAAREPELRGDLDEALAAATRVRDTTEDILEVRLLEERKLPARRVPCSAEDVVRQAVRALDAAASERRTALHVTLRGDPIFPLDPKLVRRAVENLLANAIRYGPAGGAVEVAVRREGRSLEIEVADRGPGVPPLVHPTLFEKFGAVEADHQARRGYGLGLYLVKLVAQAHGGTVAVHDRPGGGAVFHLRLREEGVA